MSKKKLKTEAKARADLDRAREGVREVVRSMLNGFTSRDEPFVSLDSAVDTVVYMACDLEDVLTAKGGA